MTPMFTSNSKVGNLKIGIENKEFTNCILLANSARSVTLD